MTTPARRPPDEVMAAFAGGDAAPLIKWVEDGADGQISWCSPGDFDDCVSVMSEHLDSPEGFCQLRHISVCGGPAGSEDHTVRDTATKMGENAAMPMTRDALIASFTAEQAEALAVELQASYEAVTAEARERLGTEPYWTFISQAERDKAASSGAAMPDGSYPITTCDGDNSVSTAISAVGRGSAGHNAIRKHIMSRASSLGCASKIPDNWNSDGSLKASAQVEEFAQRLADLNDDERGQLLAQFAPPPPPPPHAPPAAPPPPPGGKAPTPPAPPDKAAPGSPADAKADSTITEAVAAAKAAVDHAVELQQGDPDSKSDPKDAKVLAGLEQASKIMDGVVTDQAADASEPDATKGPPPPPKAPTPPPPPAKGPPPPPPAAASTNGQTGFAPTPGGNTTPGNADGVPNDADDNGPGPGDIEDAEICQNPQCGHTGAEHEDDPELGGNSGPCTSCNCPGMIPAGDVVSQPDVAPTPAPVAAGEEKAGAEAEAFAPPPPPPSDGPPKAPAMPPEPTGLPPLDPTPSMTLGPQFTIPVAWIEGAPTGDGRMIDAPTPDTSGLTWRTPPLALMGLKTSPHDPSGFSPNDPAVLIGRVDAIERDGTTGKATGHLLTTDDGVEWAGILEQMGRMGVSIDVGNATVQTTPGPVEAGVDVFDVPLMDHLVEGQVMGITVCPFAAFEGAFIVLGDGTNVPEGTLPKAPAEAQMAIRYVDEEPCVPCSEAEEEALVASVTAQGPSLLHPPSVWFDDPAFIDGDPRVGETVNPKTGKPSGKFACPITVTEEGEVFGHIAQWGVCHQSPAFLNNGQCIMAPRSRSNYERFHGDGRVVTAEGQIIGVGRMTADTGHAGESMDYHRAMAHYDNSGLTTALVRAGEDKFGIWIHGALHPSATEEQVFTLRANPPSGDWRPWGAGRELTNVLFVNNAGFPMVMATKNPHSGEVTRLVAAGVPMFHLPEELHTPTIEERLERMERGLRPVFGLAMERLRARAESIRA